MQDPLFSIIIPTFNSSKTLKECLNSVFEQSFISYEVLIIDSASSDGTLTILNEFALNHANLKVYSEKDKGIYDAMNKGMGLAKGEWLYFLGSDDTFHNTRVLSHISNAIGNTTKKVVYGNVEIVGNTAWAKNGDVYAGRFTTQKLLSQNICHQAIFYNRLFVLKNIGNYNLDYVKSADWDYNLKCWAKQEFEFSDLVVANYSVAGFSGNTGDVNLSNDFVNNLINYFGFTLFNPLINTSNFVFYLDVLKKQKEKHYLRYCLGSINRIFKKIINKLS
jgi:glycosyltransferase involved in cell wall biosynthesis